MASDDEQPANIRSRIAVFEGISAPGTAAKSQQIPTQRKASDPPKLPAKPLLPPRKAGSGSSVQSQSQTESVLPASTSSTGNASDNVNGPLTGIARPPPPKPTVTRSPAQSISLTSPPASVSASTSSLPSASLATFAKPPSRSSTLSSTSSTGTSAPSLPPRPGSSTPTPGLPSSGVVSPRATPAPPVNRRMLPPEVRPVSPGSLSSKSTASISISTSTPPKRNGTLTDAHPLAYRQQPSNILRSSPAGQGNIVAVPKRYLDLWERLIQAVKPSVPAEDARIEGIYIREIWTKSKLKNNVLARIWLQCDPEKTGSLNRQGFVKGMGSIDDQLRQNSQRRRLRR